MHASFHFSFSKTPTDVVRSATCINRETMCFRSQTHPALPYKAAQANPGWRTTKLPAVNARRTTEEARHAGALLAWSPCRAPQPRTATEIAAWYTGLSDSRAAKGLRKDRPEALPGADVCKAVVLGPSIERRFCGKSWYGHVAPPISSFTSSCRSS